MESYYVLELGGVKETTAIFRWEPTGTSGGRGTAVVTEPPNTKNQKTVSVIGLR